jgi:hypothetical protein
VGDWGLGPTPQSPIPNPQSPIPNLKIFFKKIKKYQIYIIKLRNDIIHKY